MNYRNKADLEEKPWNHSGSLGSPTKGGYK
jgi:hypothetical protein